MINGIDVSRWQGHINWQTVAKQVQFAIIKIGGSDVGFYMDGMAVRNVLEARSAGVPIGFYVYLGGVFPVADEIQHIKNLINNIGGLKPGEPLCLDWEENHANEVGYLHAIAKGLIDAGIAPPLIYMNLSYVRRQDWKPLVDLNCGLWVAAWGNNDAHPDTPPPSDEWHAWAIWQYSSTGNIPGISGKVDLNLFQGDVAAFHKYGGTRPVSMPSPVNPSKAVSSAGTSEYTIMRGETLTSIGAKFNRSWQEIWALNRDRVSNPNKIFTGQRIRVPAVAAPAPAALPTSTHNPHNRTHVVENGENLSVIAARYGLASWVFLWEANKAIIPDPDMIRPGQVLTIP